MMGFLMNKKPVYFETDIDGNGTSVNILMTEGLAEYTAETYPCIAQLSNEIGEDVSWITGHSLGGAAATLYKLLIDSPNADLVTFGSVPTLPIDTNNAECFDWPGTDCDNSPGMPAARGLIDGTRYFHKFDPATSYLMHFMSVAHEVDTVYMFFDTQDDNCADLGPVDMTTLSSPYEKYNYGPGSMSDDDVDSIEDDLYNFLCDNYDVATNSVIMDKKNYYGYMAANTPVPCAEALVSQVWAYVQTLPYVSGNVPAEIWLPNEDFFHCSESYTATLSAYTATYYASFLHDEHEIFTDSTNLEKDMYMAAIFYAWFGLFWIHSSYPNYKMADVDSDDYDSDYSDGYGPDDYDYSTLPDVENSEDPLFALADELRANLPQLLDSDGVVNDVEGVMKDWLDYDWDAADDSSGGDTGGGDTGGGDILGGDILGGDILGGDILGGDIKLIDWKKIFDVAKQENELTPKGMDEVKKVLKLLGYETFHKLMEEGSPPYEAPDCETAYKYKNLNLFTAALAPKCFLEDPTFRALKEEPCMSAVDQYLQSEKVLFNREVYALLKNKCFASR